jgi:hypothetical protein
LGTFGKRDRLRQNPILPEQDHKNGALGRHFLYLFQAVDRPVADHPRDLLGRIQSRCLLNDSYDRQRLKVLRPIEDDGRSGYELV